MRIAQPSRLLGYLPLYIAVEGTEHDLLTCDTADKAIEAVAAGQADLSIGDPFMFEYVDYAAGDLVIVAGFAKRVFHSLVTFSPFISAANEKELAGKTLVCYPEPSTAFFIARNLKAKYKLGNLLQTPFNTELGPLLTQEADAAIVMEPNTAYALKNGAKELINFATMEAVMTGFCAKSNYAKTHRKELELFFQKIKNGIGVFMTDTEATLRIAKKYFPLTDSVILAEAIANLRQADIYCRELRFTDDEIREGIKLRNLSLSFEQVKRFLR